MTIERNLKEKNLKNNGMENCTIILTIKENVEPKVKCEKCTFLKMELEKKLTDSKCGRFYFKIQGN